MANDGHRLGLLLGIAGVHRRLLLGPSLSGIDETLDVGPDVGFVVGAVLIGAVAHGTSLRWAFGVPAVLTLVIVALARSFNVAPRFGPGPVQPAAAARDMAA